MMRALFAGVTGLRSHQTRMDVIGNNIANVNTLGFKKSQTTFSDLFSETISPSSAPSGNSGGINAKQVGLGVSVASVVVKHSPGAAQYTGNPLDMTIDGDGFFVVRTADGNQYTRAGNFTVSSNGSLVDAKGNFVQCYNSVWKQGDAGKSKANSINGESSTYFDNFAYTEDPTAIKTAPSGSYTFSVDPATGAVKLFKDEIDITPAGGLTLAAGAGNILNPPLTDTGALTDNTAYTLTIPGLGEITFQASADVTAGDGDSRFQNVADVLNNANIEVINNDGFIAGNTVGDLTIDLDKYYNVSVNEQGAIVAQIKETTLDPITGSGTIKAGSNVVLGYVALASFNNVEGLQKAGGNLYVVTPNSGQPRLSTAGSGGVGNITPSSLEMSNVDLSEEMVNMITTQRGFQANSRVITATDQMLEELVNLKR
jgi:flagellar hook protein FlgE